jgi:hypothetical protein
MALDSEFIEAVDSKNKRLVRSKLGNIITIDPTLKTFKEMLVYAESNISDLFDVNSGALKSNRSDWTKDYYNEQQTELRFNFSRERIQLVCDIAIHLYGDRINTITENRSRESQGSSTKTVGVGAFGAGALVAGIGAIVKAPILVGIGLAMAVIGVVIFIKNSQE